MNFLVSISSKSGQGGSGSKNQKILPTSLMEAPKGRGGGGGDADCLSGKTNQLRALISKVRQRDEGRRRKEESRIFTAHFTTAQSPPLQTSESRAQTDGQRERDKAMTPKSLISFCAADDGVEEGNSRLSSPSLSGSRPFLPLGDSINDVHKNVRFLTASPLSVFGTDLCNKFRHPPLLHPLFHDPPLPLSDADITSGCPQR